MTNVPFPMRDPKMKPLILKPAALLALLSLPAAVQAQTAASCVTRTEAQSLIQFVLPDAITGVRDKCAPNLSSDAFLTRSGADLAQRYKPGATQAWPKAKPVALRMAGDAAKLLSALPDEATRALASNLVSSAVAKEVPVERCGAIDRLMEAVAPLPPANMAMLIVTLMEFQPKSGQTTSAPKANGLTICSIAPAAASISSASK